MYIYKIYIKNFRNIKEITWKPNKGTNIIIGGNGVGKTNIAVALNYLFNPYIHWYKKEISEFDYYNRQLNNNIEIEVWLKDVDNFIENDWELMLEHIDEEDNINECGEEVILRTKFYAKEDQVPHHVILSNGEEFKLTTSQKDFINFKYVETNRNVLKDLSLNDRSVLQSLLDKEKIEGIIGNLTNGFLEKSKEVFNREAKELFGDLHNNISGFDITDGEAAITLEATELSDNKTLKNFTLMCKNKGNTEYIPITYQSEGIKNIFLLSALANEMKNSGILFIEEIEANIEPALQRKVIKNLILSDERQTFITTHSIDVLKMFKFKDIFIINGQEIMKLPLIDPTIDIYYRSAVEHQVLSNLFSKAVLLVEGEAEQGAVPVISKMQDEFLDENYIGILRCKGKDNIIKFAKFYNEIGIKNIAIYDNDDDIMNQLEKYNREELNTLVLVVPKDYEDILVRYPLFKRKWKEIFLEMIPFDINVYFNKMFVEGKAPKNLKLFYEMNKAKFKGIKDIYEIENLMQSEDKLDMYLHGFLHKNLAGISNAERVMEYIYYLRVNDLYDCEIDEYKKIFQLISIYLGKRCPNGECFIQSNSTENCKMCGEYREHLNNVIQIKGGEYES